MERILILCALLGITFLSLPRNSNFSAAAAQQGPFFVAGNPSCATLNASTDPNFASITSDFGFKLEGFQVGGPFTLTNPPGVLTGGAPADPNNSVTISLPGSPDPLGQSFNWTATLGIDAVIVKGGPDGNAYVYTPEAFFGNGLHSPINPNNGQYYGISHIEFCYDYELTVSKTANPTFTRSYDWTIEKTVTPETIDMFNGDSQSVQYTITLDQTGFTDSDWAVSGTITILNNTPFAATVQSVTDVISGSGPDIPVDVNCGIGFPAPLAPGAQLNCTYSTALANGDQRLNTATVAATGNVGGGTATADIIFGDPTSVVNAEVNVDDTNNDGDGGPFSNDASYSYNRTFACGGDSGLHNNTATIVETGQSDSAAVQVNCYVLDVSKTAETTYTRTYDWTVEKSVDQSSLILTTGQSFIVNYAVEVSGVYADSNFAANGTIAVHNPAPIAATINSVTDVLAPNIAANVECGVAFPYSLAAGGTLNCTYSADLPDASARLNTATATLQNYADGVPSGTTAFSGTANAVFGAPTTQIDECVDVTDSYAGALGTVCFSGPGTTYTQMLTYSREIGPYPECGEFIVTNTATIIANDTGATDSDGANVSVSIPCDGCTLTIGYWKTHAGLFATNRNNPDEVSQWLPMWLGTPGDPKSILVTTNVKAVEILNFDTYSGGASNGINKLLAQMLGAQLNVAAGADSSSIDATLAAVNAFLAGPLHRPELDDGGWSLLTRAQKNQINAWMTTLDDYNNGVIGPGHCSQ